MVIIGEKEEFEEFDRSSKEEYSIESNQDDIKHKIKTTMSNYTKQFRRQGIVPNKKPVMNKRSTLMDIFQNQDSAFK